MRSLVLFDSQFGNTQKVAEIIAKQLHAKAVSIKHANADSLPKLDLLVIGSPTQGGTAKPSTLDFIKSIPGDALTNVRVATFDTRMPMQAQGFALRLVMRLIGFAAPKMAAMLRAKGATVVCEPEGFIVTDKEGPLQVGELPRAEAWAKSLPADR